jgi:hypothetical protein
MFDLEHRLALSEAQRRLDEHTNKFPLPNEVFFILNFVFRIQYFVFIKRNKN